MHVFNAILRTKSLFFFESAPFAARHKRFFSKNFISDRNPINGDRKALEIVAALGICVVLTILREIIWSPKKGHFIEQMIFLVFSMNFYLCANMKMVSLIAVINFWNRFKCTFLRHFQENRKEKVLKQQSIVVVKTIIKKSTFFFTFLKLSLMDEWMPAICIKSFLNFYYN